MNRTEDPWEIMEHKARVYGLNCDIEDEGCVCRFLDGYGRNSEEFFVEEVKVKGRNIPINAPSEVEFKGIHRGGQTLSFSGPDMKCVLKSTKTADTLYCELGDGGELDD